MAKRKREAADAAGAVRAPKALKEDVPSHARDIERKSSKGQRPPANGHETAKHSAKAPSTVPKEPPEDSETAYVQVVTGSYERVLHGFVAALPQTLVTGPASSSTDQETTPDTDTPQVTFSDTFLFTAHASAIRCLALSPPSTSSKVILASGSTDARINLYTLSSTPPHPSNPQKPHIPSLNGASIAENAKNKELGSLLHHASSITALSFPSRSKLLTASEDNSIAIVRTRDWTPLSSIKAPIPKPTGRPSGDTAAPGEVPAGISAFAVHPSMKLMVSVGRGEKCMRLWNLVTGRKAGVLNFGREVLGAVGEGRFGSGEGRRVVWDGAGEEFAVGFERGVMVFGIDCKAKAKVVPVPRTKVHQMAYLPEGARPATLLVSTEDGRVLVYDTSAATSASSEDPETTDAIPAARLMAQIGGPAAGIAGRLKDFELLQLPNTEASIFLVVTASSDGSVRLWRLDARDLEGDAETSKEKGFAARQVGRLLGTYSTGTRITCLKAFAMTGTPDDTQEEADEPPVEKSGGSDESSNEESE